MANLVAFCTYMCFIGRVLSSSETVVKFPKDQNMDVVFPPSVSRSPYASDIPLGHLRPLGYQRKSAGHVSTTPEELTAHALHMKFLKNNKPVLLNDVIKKKEPILTRWSNDTYLNDKYGNLNMKVAIKRARQKQHTTHEMMTFSTFLEDYKHDDWYLSSTIPHEMMEEIPLPEFLQCGSYHDRLQEAELWMSSGGTASLLHSHEDHTAHCVLFGRKDFIVIEKQYRKNFGFIEKYPHAGVGHSPLDMDMISVFKFPDISHTPWNHATLRQGDCIITPAGYLHQVRSYGRSISFTILFSPTRDFDSSDCRKLKEKRAKMNETMTLGDVNFVWISKNGQKKFSEPNMEPGTLKKILWLLTRNEDRLYFEQFEHFYKESLPMCKNPPSAREVFDILASSAGKEYLSRDYLKNINTHKLLHVSRIYKDAYAEEKLMEAGRDEL